MFGYVRCSARNRCCSISLAGFRKRPFHVFSILKLSYKKGEFEDEETEREDSGRFSAGGENVLPVSDRLHSPFSLNTWTETNTNKNSEFDDNTHEENGEIVHNPLSEGGNIKTPLDPSQFFSPLKHVRSITAARFLSKNYNLQKTDVATFVFHQKNIYKVEVNGLLRAGSFVEYAVSDIPGSEVECGIVLNNQQNRLTTAQIYYILTSDGRIDRIVLPQVNFMLPEFICTEKVIPLTDSELEKFSSSQSIFYTKDACSPPVLLYFAKLAYTINTLIEFQEKLKSVIFSRELDEAAFIKFGQTQKQCSVSIHRFGSYLLKDDTLKYIITPHTNVMGLSALLYTVHRMMCEDPVHFRVNLHNSAIENDLKAFLNPIEQIDSHYFVNPINLVPVLHQIDQTSVQELEKNYKLILHKRLKYRIFVLLAEDLRFFNFIRFMKYTIEYPHERFLRKLAFLDDHASASGPARITPAQLYRLLIEFGIYNPNTNPVLSSGIYGVLKQSLVSNMRCSSLSQLMPYAQVDRVAIYDKSKNKELNIKVPSSDKVKASVREVEGMLKRGELKPDNASSSNFVTKLAGIEFPTVIYRIDWNLALAVRKISMTQYKFSFFVPVPRNNVKSWMISNPVSFPRLSDDELQGDLVGLYDQIPRDKKYRNTLPKPILSFKISFVFDYLKSESLIDPEIEVSLDSFRHTQMLERIDISKESDRRKIMRLATRDKLDNLLKQKEHARLQHGLLRLNPDSENNGLSSQTCSQSGLSGHMVSEVRFMLDEFLSLYCRKRGIPVISRSIDVDRIVSADSRKSRKFRIFKWYANSYDSFRQGGSLDLSSFVSGLRYLKPMKISIRPNGEMAPLGLSHYASFTASDYLESYVNRIQVLKYLTHDKMLDMRTLQPKIQSNCDAFLDLKRRLRRYITLSGLKRSIETQFGRMRLFRCVVVDPPYTTLICGIKRTMNAKAYCIDLDLMVEIDLAEKSISRNLMVGDRLICTRIIEVDSIGGQLTLR